MLQLQALDWFGYCCSKSWQVLSVNEKSFSQQRRNTEDCEVNMGKKDPLDAIPRKRKKVGKLKLCKGSI